MKILLTGATGFIGSHLFDLLSPHHEIFCLVRNLEKAKKQNLTKNLVRGDLAKSSIDQWVQSLPSDIEMVIHTASILFTFDTNEFYKTNYESNIYLVEKLKERFPDLHFAFISSQAAVGPSAQGGPRTESSIPSPISHYGKSKLLFEEYLKTKSPPSWKISIFRPPMVIGPRDTGMKQFFDMVRSRFVFLPGLNALKKEYSFISVFDLVNLMEDCLFHQRHTPYQVYHLAYPEKIQFFELIRVAQDEMKIKQIFSFPMPLSFLKIIVHFLKALSSIIKVPNSLNQDKLIEMGEDSWIILSEKINPDLYRFDLKKTVRMTLKEENA